MTENAIAREIVGAPYRPHRVLGPGLFEIIYETILTRNSACHFEVKSGPLRTTFTIKMLESNQNPVILVMNPSVPPPKFV